MRTSTRTTRPRRTGPRTKTRMAGWRMRTRMDGPRTTMLRMTTARLMS